MYPLSLVLLLIIVLAGSTSLSSSFDMNAAAPRSRVAVVTGANKGIGYHIAHQLASSGQFTDVILGCRDQRRGESAASDIASTLESSSPPCTVSYHQLTIGDKASHDAFRNVIANRYGKVDVLVNNAGIAFKGADPTPFKDQCLPTLGVNFWGTVDFTEQMLPLVRKGTDARIVSVASMAGHLSQLRSPELQQIFHSANENLTKNQLFELVEKFQFDVLHGRHRQEGWGDSNYGFSKLALIAITKIWAREEASNGIAVNCCCPGYCATDMSSHRGSRHPSDGAKNAVLPCLMDNPPIGQYFSDFTVSRW